MAYLEKKMISFRQSYGVKPANIVNGSKVDTNRRHSFSTAVGTVSHIGSNAKVPLRGRGSRLSPALPSVSTDNTSATGSTHGVNVARRRISLDKVRVCSTFIHSSML